jgi:predicted DNA-binding protein with PD1-like motif
MSTGEFLALRLKPHQDLKVEILKFAVANDLKAAAIVSCAGSLEQYNIRFANEPDGTFTKGFFEIVSLSGTFSATSSHLHISVSDNKGVTIGGHLMNNTLVYTTAEIVIVELADLEFTRETDPIYGFQELVVKQRRHDK